MIELTDEMRTRLYSALADGCPVVAATVDAEGQPKLSFYGSTHVHSSDSLGVWIRKPDSGVLTRLQANPRMTLMYRHAEDRVFWQFFGRAQVIDDPGRRDQVWEGMNEVEQMLDSERNGVALVIELDKVTGRGVDMRRGI